MTSTSNNLQTHQQTNRLDFLFEAGHTMFSKCPSLSRYYMNEFQNTLTEYELTAHKPIARLSCKSCGQINIPGLNHHIEIVQKKTKKKANVVAKKTQSKNLIKSTCLACGNTSLYHGSCKKKMPKLIMQKEIVIAEAPIVLASNSSTSSPPPPPPPPTTTTTTDSSIKKKKNKGKKNNLKALLSKQQKPNNSGGLGDFLSSL
ncbi:hypothetical protein INT46_009989 [Mucor plumbeus]|uniref:Rpr2-domain-containing protein n=1 Tax=Mucor plumbeus TaxID=97098 RepID=A0A8H7R104_9FUNG|nr:hypothetical protein INT46_009989 [Mucor plumbeus]